MIPETIKIDPIHLLKSNYLIDNFDLNGATMKDVKILREVADKIEYKLKQINKPLFDIYPNKFKVISNINEINENNYLYYFNSKISDYLKLCLSNWIESILSKKSIHPAGYIRASISFSDFCNRYHYDRSKLGPHLNNPTSLINTYYETYSINSIRFNNNKIVLYGELIRSQNNYMTITESALFMNVLNILLQRGITETIEYLKRCMGSVIYNYTLSWNMLYINTSTTSSQYMINYEKGKEIQEHLDYLKRGLVY